MPRRLIAWICAAVTLPMLWASAHAAGSAGVRGWQAVLIAGDNAEPVFDNAIGQMEQFLTAQGVPAGNIRRLSATGDPRNPVLEPATASRVLQRIATMQPRPGEGCFVFITSHGQRSEGVWLALSGDFLSPAALARALGRGCGRVPTVVVVSACYSGSFAGPPMTAPNRIILTAARPDRPSFGCQADRTYTVYDECLLSTLSASPTWQAVFGATTACVGRREQQLQVLPSQPRASFGAAVKNLALR